MTLDSLLFIFMAAAALVGCFYLAQYTWRRYGARSQSMAIAPIGDAELKGVFVIGTSKVFVGIYNGMTIPDSLLVRWHSYSGRAHESELSFFGVSTPNTQLLPPQKNDCARLNVTFFGLIYSGEISLKLLQN